MLPPRAFPGKTMHSPITGTYYRTVPNYEIDDQHAMVYLLFSGTPFEVSIVPVLASSSDCLFGGAPGNLEAVFDQFFPEAPLDACEQGNARQ